MFIDMLVGASIGAAVAIFAIWLRRRDKSSDA